MQGRERNKYSRRLSRAEQLTPRKLRPTVAPKPTAIDMLRRRRR
jgi:hypothetical protein